MSGRPLFTGANHVAVLYRHSHEVPPLPEEVPESLAQAIMRSLAKRPAGRFPDSAALEKALAEIPAEPVGSRGSPCHRWLRHGRSGARRRLPMSFDRP